ncbi:hypothetical protein KDL45_14945, partial [bacterium]|nr:hypothetical protein [bacterium]
VWMGFTMASLRHLRGTNIGTEKQAEIDSKACEAAYSRIGNVNGLPGRTRGMLARYVNDMNNVVKEFGRVLKDDGRAIVVIGDCTIRGFYIKNSDAIVALAEAHSFVVTDFDKRPIEERRRYLPPPKRRLGDGAIHNRMRFESIITFEKSA